MGNSVTLLFFLRNYTDTFATRFNFIESVTERSLNSSRDGERKWSLSDLFLENFLSTRVQLVALLR